MSKRSKDSRRRQLGLFFAAILAISSPSLGQSITATPVVDGECALGCKRFTVTSRDGTRLSVQEWGNPRGPAVLFVHGFSQSHLTWIKQVTDPQFAAGLRMVTFDLRGHGESDQPLDPEKYTRAQLWAADVNAVIRQMDLWNPVLVGHSLGTTIIGDYLLYYGDGQIGGMNFVGGFIVLEDVSFVALGEEWANEVLPGVDSTDIYTNIQMTKRFNRLLTDKPLKDEDAMDLLAHNMMVPPEIRNALILGRLNAGGFVDHQLALEDTTVPVLISHGEEDAIVLFDLALAVEAVVNGRDGNGNGTLSVYPGGHTPPVEAPGRFNEELYRLVLDANY